MVRDFSSFLPGSPDTGQTPKPPSRLEALGWGPFFAGQTDLQELTEHPPVRVVAVHRSGHHVLGETIDQTIPPVPEVTVGDWIMLDPDQPGDSRMLERKSLIKRRAPGTDWQVQLIASNIDTAFIVTSCNQDFNLARLERYAALAFDAEIEPVILLTKSDLVADPQPWIDQASSISERISVLALDALSDQPELRLAPWCKPGKTVAFLGSSGVGKSTLTNTLMGNSDILTKAIREDDARGRHTTTRRELHVIPGRCIVLDTPGMRELQLADASFGISDVFEDIETIAQSCRFADCKHDKEPDCAIHAAVNDGRLDATRLARWQKLMAEDAVNTASLAQRKSKDRALSKLVRSAKKVKTGRKS